jgi:hypothetical protein
MKKTMLILAAAVMTLLPMSASAAWRGGVVIRPYYGFGGFYNPYWGAYWGPGYNPYYFANPNAGEVKLDTKVKTAEVFINGAFAGNTHDNKTMHLRPGNYKIEIREEGQTRFAQNVYVVAGKTLHITPAL